MFQDGFFPFASQKKLSSERWRVCLTVFMPRVVEVVLLWVAQKPPAKGFCFCTFEMTSRQKVGGFLQAVAA